MCRPGSSKGGGFTFAARPDQTASHQPVFWTSAADPGVINLVETPDALMTGSDEGGDLGEPAGGHHLATGRVASSTGFQLELLGRARSDRPLAAVIPLDGMARDRLSAVDRFLRVQRDQSAPDRRLTPAQRSRLVHMLRALDGRTQGVSYRDLALALFGRRLIDPAEWQDSSFRYTTLRLVRDGERMVAGGYRQLLRGRRQP